MNIMNEWIMHERNEIWYVRNKLIKKVQQCCNFPRNKLANYSANFL